MQVTYRNYEVLMEPLAAVPTPEELFDFQVKALKEKGVIQSGKTLEGLKKHLPNRGMVLVVPETALSFSDLLTRVVVDGKSGKNWLDPQYHEDLVQVPEGPYLCLEVEDGRRMLNKSVNTTRAEFAKKKRSGLVTREGIFLTVSFPEILKHHFVDLAGSRYSEEFAPDLCLCAFFGRQPKLYSYRSHLRGPKWGSASCGSRVGL